ncbi:hypothetical protein, partial [Shinella sp.]
QQVLEEAGYPATAG